MFTKKYGLMSLRKCSIYCFLQILKQLNANNLSDSEVSTAFNLKHSSTTSEAPTLSLTSEENLVSSIAISSSSV